jgi:fructose-1,6-bisphosphatase/inositol monophosphatase family enzyme
MDDTPTDDTPTDDADLLRVLHDAADAVRVALDSLDDWGLAGTRDGQYRSDIAADAAAIAVLDAAGFGVVSEESGEHHLDRSIVVVLDPVDGSTNASRGVPWYATSLCAVDRDGLRAAVVVNQSGARPTRFEATRGGGARCDGMAIRPTGCERLGEAIVGLNGLPPRWLGWKQFRSLGAAALDLCAVASGVLDAYVDCTRSGLAPWDYLGGMLICQESGSPVVDVAGKELVTWGLGERRVLAAAATPALLDGVVAARATFP